MTHDTPPPPPGRARPPNNTQLVKDVRCSACCPTGDHLLRGRRSRRRPRAAPVSPGRRLRLRCSTECTARILWAPHWRHDSTLLVRDSPDTSGSVPQSDPDRRPDPGPHANPNCNLDPMLDRIVCVALTVTLTPDLTLF